MTNSEKLAWEQQRVKGRNCFLLRTIMREGVAFGLTVTAGTNLWSLWKHQPLEPIWRVCMNFAILTLVFGYGRGWQAWASNEADYNKETEGGDVT